MPKVPKYRHRRDRDLGFAEVRVDGRPERTYFPGKWYSPESLAAYHAWAQRLIHARQLPAVIPGTAAKGLSVAEIVGIYLDHAITRYRKNGRPSNEYQNLRLACQVLVSTHGEAIAEEFGPVAIKQVRQAMIDGSWREEDQRCKARPWSRGFINHQVARIRRVFRWAAENEFCPASVWQALSAVAPLARGQTAAPETEPVKPASAEAVLTTMWAAPLTLAKMIRVHQLTGMRPETICLLRPKDLDRSAQIWWYRPPDHKGTWRGKSLAVPIGPRAQAILAPMLAAIGSNDFVFPAEQSANGRSLPHYTTSSYRQAVGRAVRRANRRRTAGPLGMIPIEDWTPNQLRHSRASDVRAKYGIEAAQVLLGHARADVTQVYAERDLALAARVAMEVG